MMIVNSYNVIVVLFVHILATLLLLLTDEDPCDNHTCPTGSQCEVFKPTGKAYCMPSCDLDNGGCPDDEVCSLQYLRCLNPPCLPQVKCSPRKYTKKPYMHALCVH